MKEVWEQLALFVPHKFPQQYASVTTPTLLRMHRHYKPCACTTHKCRRRGQGHTHSEVTPVQARNAYSVSVPFLTSILPVARHTCIHSHGLFDLAASNCWHQPKVGKATPTKGLSSFATSWPVESVLRYQRANNLVAGEQHVAPALRARCSSGNHATVPQQPAQQPAFTHA